MKHTYRLTGMTCNGCKASVEKHIKTLPHIIFVEADVAEKTVTINSTESIALQELKNILPEKFSISELAIKSVFPETKVEAETSELKQLYPLFLIFLYIVLAALFINYKALNLQEFMLDFMGLFYIVFSFFKLLDYKGFPESFKMYDPLAKHIPVYAWIYPFIETVLGVLFLTRTELTSALIATLVILGITTIGVTQSLLSKKAIKCACLGTALKLPMTKATFIENSIMIVMAVYMLVQTLF